MPSYDRDDDKTVFLSVGSGADGMAAFGAVGDVDLRQRGVVIERLEEWFAVEEDRFGRAVGGCDVGLGDSPGFLAGEVGVSGTELLDIRGATGEEALGGLFGFGKRRLALVRIAGAEGKMAVAGFVRLETAENHPLARKGLGGAGDVCYSGDKFDFHDDNE